MKIKNLFMYFAVGAFALTSCNNDDNKGVEVPEGEFSFFLKVSREDGTRADAAQVADQTDVTFDNGALLFADASGNIVRTERITNSFSTGTVTPQQLEDGHLFAGIDASAVTVHIVGNVDFNGLKGVPANTPLSFGNMSEFDAAPYILTLADQTDSDYGITKASLYGEDNLVAAWSSNALTNGATREAHIELRPLIARFEIEKISADASVSDDLGQEWKLEAIYIDDFHYKSTVIGTNSDFQDIVYNDAATASGVYPDVASYLRYSRFNDGNSTTFGHYGLNPAWDPILFDDGGEDSTPGTIVGLGEAASNSIAATEGAWSYNLYPDATYKPHIIIHLTNVWVSDGLGGFVKFPNTKTGIDGEAYLTVTNYKVKGSSNPDQMLTLEGGYIYKIANLAFTDSDLREEPEQPETGKEKLDVWVEVELMKWTAVDTDVVFN